MCVIIVKPAGASMPTKKELFNAHTCNPHGMGFASPSVQYKGMSFETFYKKLKQVPSDEPCIIHFRFATNGSIKRANCHPFKLGNVWFAHNGVLSIIAEKDLTDSETAFRHIIYPAIKKYGLNSPQTALEIKKIIGMSKFAFMQGKKITLFGQYTEHEGRYYSNVRHLYVNMLHSRYTA